MGGAVEGGRGGARAGGGGLTEAGAWTTVVARRNGAKGSGIGGSGRTAGRGMTQAAHLAGWVLPPGPSMSPPTWMVMGPWAEQMTMGWPGVAAAMAPKGSRVPSVIAKTAARKASDRTIDQVSTRERLTNRALAVPQQFANRGEGPLSGPVGSTVC